MRHGALKIISQIMNVPIDQLNEDSSPETIANWDSLKHMNLIMALEEKFAVAFSDEEIVDMLSVKSIVDILSKKQPKGSTTA
jgi:acyl carrier protein